MGQAKQRGNFEERQSAAIAAREKAQQERAEIERQRRIESYASTGSPRSTQRQRPTHRSLTMACAMAMIAAAPAPEGAKP